MGRLLSCIKRVLRAIGHEIAETIRFGALPIDAAGYRQHDADAVIAIVNELQEPGEADDAEGRRRSSK